MPSSERQIELRKAKKSLRIESELSALEAAKIFGPKHVIVINSYGNNISKLCDNEMTPLGRYVTVINWPATCDCYRREFGVTIFTNVVTMR